MVGGIDVIKHPEKVREVIGLSGQYAEVDETAVIETAVIDQR